MKDMMFISVCELSVINRWSDCNGRIDSNNDLAYVKFWRSTCPRCTILYSGTLGSDEFFFVFSLLASSCFSCWCAPAGMSP